MFLKTSVTDTVKLIYPRTKDYLFSNLRSSVFDFLENRGKKNRTSNTFFLSREATRAPTINKVTSGRSVIKT